MKTKVLLRGVKACTGVVRGKVYCIFDTTKPAPIKPGRIIVTTFTTPVVAGAIASAAGLICEIGGLTSHGAIIAREFNIPCLVGTKQALSVLRDGQNIVLDANRGVVHAA